MTRRVVNLRTKLHISYIDQLVVPAIFNYLIGAKIVGSIYLNLRWPGVAGASGVVARSSSVAPPRDDVCV